MFANRTTTEVFADDLKFKLNLSQKVANAILLQELDLLK